MRRAQLSIRRWMLYVAICAAPAAVWAWRVRVEARQDRAVVEIARLGGSVECGKRWAYFWPAHVVAVDLSGCRLAQSKDWERVFGALADVEFLDLSESDVDDEILAVIARSCHCVRRLNLSQTAVTDAGLAQLGGWPALAELDVSLTQVSGAAFTRAERTEKFGALGNLRAYGIPLSRRGARAIAELRNLAALNLGATQVTADDIRAIAASSSIQDLDLSQCPIETDIVRKLARLTTLRRLSLARGDSGVHRVAAWCIQRIDPELLLSDGDSASPPILSSPPFSIAPLSRLPRLEHLDVTCANVEWKELGGDTFANLKDLRLAASGIDDASASCLASFPALEILDASDTRLSAAGLRWLACHGLKELTLERTNVDGSAAKPIARFLALEKVSVDDTRLGNDGAKMLLSLPRLEVLTMAGTAVDDAIVERLKAKATLRALDLADTRISATALADIARQRPEIDLRH